LEENLILTQPSQIVQKIVTYFKLCELVIVHWPDQTYPKNCSPCG